MRKKRQRIKHIRDKDRTHKEQRKWDRKQKLTCNGTKDKVSKMTNILQSLNVMHVKKWQFRVAHWTLFS